MLLTACTVQTDPIAVTRVVATAVATPTIPTATMLPVTTTAVAATPTAIPAPTASLDEASGRWLSAINPVTIYSGSASDYAPAGVLEVGSTAKVLGNIQGDAIPIACLDDALDTCWVVWDYNALYPYEGTPLTLEIPDPASLTMASTDTAVSPDGRWQTEITRSETVLLAGDAAEFFYVEMKIISLADDRHWQPMGEWHAAGLGEEGTPRPFHWSADGRYFYYTNTFDYHGGCAVYDNIGDHLNRLDLTNGLVTSLPSPLARGILTLSPDERFMAYLSGQSLVIRELATAYDDNDTAQESVIWQIPFELAWQGQVNQIAWSADGQKVLLSVDHRLNDCAINGSSSWELDVETGVLTATTVFVPTPTPAATAVYPHISLTATIPFTQTEHGYTLRYPNGLHLLSNFDIESDSYFATQPDADSPLDLGFADFWITIRREDNPEGLSLSQWADLRLKPVEEQTVTVAGTPALRVSGDLGAAGDSHAGFGIITYFVHDGYVFTVIGLAQTDRALTYYIPAYQLLLDNFRFLSVAETDASPSG
jgi:hypothetical protein